MMIVADKALYQRYREKRGRDGRRLLHEWCLPMLLFGSIGAITWAIRGTNGWGGIDGVLVPGLAWGLLWHYLCIRKGIDARGVGLWLGLGLALGGELGYGQYVSWIRGMFHARDDVISISPWVGYAWFALCGIGWGAPGGIVLGWALHPGVSLRAWLVRAGLIFLLLLIIFNIPLPFMGDGVVSWLGAQITRHCPWLIFPHAASGLYAGELDRHLTRLVYTNTQNFAAVLWWVTALCVAALQRDRSTLFAGAVIGGGFGIGFAVSAAWCLGYSYAPAYIDWWKMWELHAGFNLGVLYVIVLHWATRRLDAAHAPGGAPKAMPGPRAARPVIAESWTALFLAFGGFLLIFSAGVEYFFWTGLFLSLFFAALMALSLRAAPIHAAELRKRVTLTYNAFLLVFMLLHGGASRAGVFLGLYAADAVGQYEWPLGRAAIFAPPAAVAIIAALVCLRRQFRDLDATAAPGALLPERMIDLFAFIGLVGAVSIWPDKIGVVYAAFVCLALYAFTRINRRFDRV